MKVLDVQTNLIDKRERYKGREEEEEEKKKETPSHFQMLKIRVNSLF